MEAMLGVSLHSYLYLILSKKLSFLLCLIFSSTKLENKRVVQVLPGSEGREKGGPNNVHTGE
jgi:hypothetical protein